MALAEFQKPARIDPLTGRETAPSLYAETYQNLQQTSLGGAPGDPNLNMPFGSKLPAARIFLRNHSTKQLRKFKQISVSARRGAAQALAADKKLREIYNMATFYDAVKAGEDLNVYGEKKQSILYAPKFDGRAWNIPPARGEEEPPTVQVPEGLWDLLMGNYERMHSPDHRVRAEEAVRYANSMVFKVSYILFVTVDGNRQMRDNPFGFIEIERRTERFAPVHVDSEFLTALEMVEA
jgi:hypothetical protein